MSAASIIWIIVFLAGVPAVTGILFARPTLTRPLLALMVFATCHIKKPFYQEVFFVVYRGVDRGFGVTIPDILFFGFFFFIAFGGTKRRIIWAPYNTWLWVLLIAASAMSLVDSQTAYYGLFSLHKLVRGFILYWVLVNLVRDRETVRTLIGAMAAAVIFQGYVVFLDRYVTKSAVNRSVGSFPHPNSLAMYVDLIIPILLSLLLSKQYPPRGNKIAMLSLALGVMCVVFTKSRASLVLMLGALAALTVCSMGWRPTTYKVQLALSGALAATLAGAVLLPSIIERFEKAPKQSAETRIYFNEAAHAMANDRPFGVGLNAYSWMLANTKYYWYVYPDMIEAEDPEEFQESKQGQSRLGTAHHIYFLFAAETGWVGMWIFLAFLGRFYWRNFVLFFKTRGDIYVQSILLGTLFGLGMLHLQGLLEWIFRQTQVFFLFCVVSALVVAVGSLPPATKAVPARASVPVGRRSG